MLYTYRFSAIYYFMSRKQRITDLLIKHLQPSVLSIEDETHLHHVPISGESHFKIVSVSKRFVSMKLLERHRYINNLLIKEFSQGLHALSLKLYTPDEWEKNNAPLNSPPCLDGYDKQ